MCLSPLARKLTSSNSIKRTKLASVSNWKDFPEPFAPFSIAHLTAMKANLLMIGAFCLGYAHFSAAQTIQANATLSDIASGLNYDYTIDLNNTVSSTSPIETLWFAWVPGQNFLPTSPLTVQPPTGWTATITGGGPGDGYGIEFVTSTSPVTPGNSLLFNFSSTDTPAELAGNSPAHPGTPVGTSFVYSGAPFSGSSASFVVQPVPEPSSFGLLLLGGLFLWRMKRRDFRDESQKPERRG